LAIMVKLYVPAAVPEAAASVSLLLPLPGDAMLAGAKLAVTPFGSPLIESVTADLNPFCAAVVRVIAVELSVAMVALVALGVNVKLGAVTVSVSEIVRVRFPPVALMVSG
jgi:hypothetical protein